VFWPETGERTGEWRELHNEELDGSYEQLTVIRLRDGHRAKRTRSAWAGHAEGKVPRIDSNFRLETSSKAAAWDTEWGTRIKLEKFIFSPCVLCCFNYVMYHILLLYLALQSTYGPSLPLIFWFPNLFRHTVGLLGRVISPSQGLYLHRTTQHRKTRTIIDALSEIRTRDPVYERSRPARPLDWLCFSLVKVIFTCTSNRWDGSSRRTVIRRTVTLCVHFLICWFYGDNWWTGRTTFRLAETVGLEMLVCLMVCALSAAWIILCWRAGWFKTLMGKTWK
jgi:hypothetical protein